MTLPPGSNGRRTIIHGAADMDRSELKEVIAAQNEKHGTNFSESDIDRELTKRANGTYGQRPSVKKYLETGDEKHMRPPED